MKTTIKLAAVAATAAMALAPSAAYAVDLSAQYDVSGTSHVAKTNSDIKILPTTLSTTVDMDTGAITGSMPIPSTTTEFKAIGFLPIKATVNFEEAAPLTGQLGRARVDTTASYYLRLSNVSIGGIPAFVGPWCRTADPVVIPASTPTGERFDLTTGGHLTGTFTIGNFQNCLLNTLLINAMVPGSGNTVDLQVSNGRLA